MQMQQVAHSCCIPYKDSPSLLRKSSSSASSSAHGPLSVGRRGFLGRGIERYTVVSQDIDFAFESQKRSTFSSKKSTRSKRNQFISLARAQKDMSDHARPSTIPALLFRQIPFFDVEESVKKLTPTQRRIGAALFLGLLSSVAWLRNLAAAGLVDDTEPLFAEAARQMIVTGDYITPQFNAQPRFDKPVLIYWLMAISGNVFGVKVWAFRLPSALCAICLLSWLFITIKRFGLHYPSECKDGETETYHHYVPAIIASAAFALNPEVVAWGSTALSDMLLTSTLGATLLSFFWGYAGRSEIMHGWGYQASAFFMGLACLSKGPVGILLPVCVCTSFLLCTGELLKVLREELPYMKGFTILLATTLPWYCAMFYRHGLTYLTTFFGYHNIERFMKGVNHHGGRPWWYGAAVVLMMYFPWSLSIIPSVIKALSSKESFHWRKIPRSKRLVLFAAIWLIVEVVFFSLSSSQLPSYYLPVAPAIAMLASSHLLQQTANKSSDLASGLAPAFLYPVIASTFLFLPALLQASGDMKAAQIGSLLMERHIHQVAFFEMLLGGALSTCTAEFASLFKPKIEANDLMHLKGGRPGGDLREQTSKQAVLPVWVLHSSIMVVFFMTFLGPVYQVVDGVRQAPIRQLAVKAAKLQEPGEPLAMVGARMPSIVFYSRLPTAFFDTEKEAAYALGNKVSSGVKSALVISEEKCEGLTEPKILAQCGNYKLFRVKVRQQRQGGAPN